MTWSSSRRSGRSDPTGHGQAEGRRTMMLVRRLLGCSRGCPRGARRRRRRQAANPVARGRQAHRGGAQLRFDMQLTVEAGGTSVAIAASGATRGQDSAKMTMSTSGGPRERRDRHVAAGGGATRDVMRSPTLRRRAPAGSMVRLDLDPGGRSSGLDYSGSSRRRGRSAARARHRVDDSVGTAAVAGKPTTRYRVVIDPSERPGGPRLREQLHAIERAGVRLPRLTEDVWIGRDGRIAGSASIPLRAAGPRDRRDDDVPRLRRSGVDLRAAARAGLRLQAERPATASASRSWATTSSRMSSSRALRRPADRAADLVDRRDPVEHVLDPLPVDLVVGHIRDLRLRAGQLDDPLARARGSRSGSPSRRCRSRPRSPRPSARASARIVS